MAQPGTRSGVSVDHRILALVGLIVLLALACVVAYLLTRSDSESSIRPAPAKATGTFTALDMTTNRIAWQKTFPDACYRGSVTTASNLVFVGRNDGRLQAYNARDGKLLWSFQTGAGANNVPTIFEQDGREYLAFCGAGSALGATAH